MIFLVIFLALVHSLLLLPVLLTLFGPGSCGGSKKRKVSETMLSPSNASLSETFIYKNGKDKCLRKQALTGDGKRRKFIITPEDVVKRNFADDESDEEPSSVSPHVNLHLSFFKPTESDVSDLNMSTRETFDQAEMSFGRRTHSDSSYYNYQKRHLRRHMKQVPQRHDRLGSRPPSIEKYPELSDERRKSVQAVPGKLENLKQAFLINNNYQVFSHEKEGSENQGFDDNEVINQSVNNKSTLSSFKPGDHQSPVESTRKGLKIVFVDHRADVQSESGGDSFDDVDITDESSKLKL
eukprot:GFUD01033181.1.p1 GENE.GFUD01033181.1~~GFUD01033181.1.p1  ORF type:complete len:326 (-),score=61.78 GFUD01033181.1:51-935(-)